MGHKYSRDQILDAAVRVAESCGLSGLSFRLVAEEIGTSDRVVVYYFADKSKLLAGILGRVGDNLHAVLAANLPPSRVGGVSRMDVLLAARRTFADPVGVRAGRLFLEAVGLSVARTEPYSSLAPQLLHDWIVWLDRRMGPNEVKSGEAAATVALIDGLLIIGALRGSEAESEAWDAVIDQARRLK